MQGQDCEFGISNCEFGKAWSIEQTAWGQTWNDGVLEALNSEKISREAITQ